MTRCSALTGAPPHTEESPRRERHDTGSAEEGTEMGNADAFLTVDDRLVRAAVRHRHLLNVAVVNPVDFVRRWLP